MKPKYTLVKAKTLKPGDVLIRCPESLGEIAIVLGFDSCGRITVARFRSVGGFRIDDMLHSTIEYHYNCPVREKFLP